MVALSMKGPLTQRTSSSLANHMKYSSGLIKFKEVPHITSQESDLPEPFGTTYIIIMYYSLI